MIGIGQPARIGRHSSIPAIASTITMDAILDMSEMMSERMAKIMSEIDRLAIATKGRARDSMAPKENAGEDIMSFENFSQCKLNLTCANSSSAPVKDGTPLF